MRNFNGFHYGVLALAALAALPAEARKKMTGDDLSNMIIQGENRMAVEPRTPEVEWSPSVYREVTDFIRNNALLSNLTPPAISNPAVTLPEKARSGKPANPWLDSIFDPPVLTLNFKASSDKKSMWTFLVKDSQGKTFYELKKKGALPQQLLWDGFGSNGKPLRVGYDYSYSFSSQDEAGNPQRFSGNPFRLNAFRYSRSGTVVSFAPESLFKTRGGSKFSSEGMDYLTEMRDYLRPHYSRKLEVWCYDDDQKFGQARARAVKNYLLDALDVPEQQISFGAAPVAKGGGYRHVDILVK